MSRFSNRFGVTGAPANKLRRAVKSVLIESLEIRRLLSSATVSSHLPAIQNPRLLYGPVPATGFSSPVGYTPAQIRNAYSLGSATSPSIQFSGISGTGAGQTIAIVDAYGDPNAASDLAQFDTQFNLPAPPSFTVVNEIGNASPLPAPDPGSGWTIEESLDIEWAHTIAPGANIVLVQTNNSSDLWTGVNTARQLPGVSVVSMSWSGGEWSTEQADEDSTFTTPGGHQGVTFLAATGDSGPPVGYPAASPNVVAVGGTQLSLDSNGNVLAESAWSEGGGGPSAYEALPTYQAGIPTASARETPDVSAIASPGVAVYDSYDYGSSGWIPESIGGTSLATPIWSGIIAIADQGRATAGLGSLDGATQTLPALYAAPQSDFNDITTGSNGYNATVGYDMASGLGSPVASALVPYLAFGTTVTTSPPTVAQAPTATPSTVLANGQGEQISLNVIGAQAGVANASSLTYQWSVQGPAGATAATLSNAGNTNANKTDTATIYQAGTYTFTVTITNASGQNVVASTQLVVSPIAQKVTVTPNPATVSDAAQQQFTASVTDQFGLPYTIQSTDSLVWSASNGSINSTGLYTAPSTGTGTDQVSAVLSSGTNVVSGSATVSFAPVASSSSLSGQLSTLAGPYSLTTLGTADWEHWGRLGIYSNVDRKKTGASQISAVSVIGSGPNVGGYTTTARTVTWTDGSPTASDIADHGYIWDNGAVGTGFSFTVPASTASSTLYIYLGGYATVGSLKAQLSGSSTSFTATPSGTGSYADLYQLTFQAAAAKQTLTVTYSLNKATTPGGSIDLMAAMLAVAQTPVKPAVTQQPASQIVNAGTPFTLTAAASGNPTPTVQWYESLNGVVAFTPILGATSTSLAVAGLPANASGTEFLAVFTNASGTATTSPVTITVNPQVAPTISSSPQSQSVNAGATVSFSASAAGTPTPTVQWQVEAPGATTFTNITNNASATTTTLTLNNVTASQNGSEYQAVFTNAAGSATTTAATLTVASSNNGSLTGQLSTLAGPYNLTQLGSTDWAHWGQSGSYGTTERKKTGASQISAVSVVGTGAVVGGYSTTARTVDWTDGSPLASDSADHGYIWNNGAVGSGFSFTVPASTAAHTLYLYLGGFATVGTLTAHLSDNSAANYVVSPSSTTNYTSLYAITFNAASANQTLTITYTVAKATTPGGSIDLIAAALN